MAILLNKSDCTSAIKGTGTLGCKVDFNYITQFHLVEKGTSFDLTSDTIDQATIDGLIQDNKYVVLPGHDSFENQSGETNYEELASGIKLPIRNGLYEFLPMFSGGAYFANALASLTAKDWDVFILDFDDSGDSRMWGEKTSDGKFKGFETFLVYAENKSFNDGSSVSTKSPLRIQFSTKGTNAMRSRASYLSSNDAVDFSNLDGVNDVVLTATDLVAASFKVSAVLASDNSTVISSNTDATNWKVTDTSDDSNVDPSGVTFVNGVYEIAGVPAGTYIVEFYDKTNSKDVIVSSGRYYDSDAITVTLT